ncbi:MAG: hypothetical protein KC468_35710 [Myxococcales bacterium]|nr:hypothetical protein [Myxococcales bacterium]
MEELGVAQSELVQAGLLANPTIGGDLLLSTRGNGLGGGVAVAEPAECVPDPGEATRGEGPCAW